MKGMKKKLILISFALSLMAAFAVFAYLQSLKIPKVNVKRTTILVAEETIPGGTLLEKKMIKEIQVTDSAVLKDYIKKSSEIVGRYTKQTIYKDEGFFIDKLMTNDENENELSFKIDANHRAISINVSGATGVSDLVKPGDYVDIIVFLSEKKDGQKVIRPDLAKVIMQDVEVLAIDKQLSRDNQGKIDDKIPTNFLVTLSVLTTEEEELVLAEGIGSLELALRPIKKEKDSNTNVVTEKELIAVDQISKKATNGSDVVKSSINGANSLKKAISNAYNYKYNYYIVKSGDTLKNISRAYYGNADNYKLISDVNNIKNVNIITPGKKIKIPVLTNKR